MHSIIVRDGVGLCQEGDAKSKGMLLVLSRVKAPTNTGLRFHETAWRDSVVVVMCGVSSRIPYKQTVAL